MIDKYLTRVEGIDGIAIKEKILNGNDTTKLFSRLKNMTHPEKTPEVFPIVSHGYLYRGPFGTSHGTPYDYDTHVPLIFSRKGFRGKKNSSHCATVDIAPTIATYLGMEIPKDCDGKGIDL